MSVIETMFRTGLLFVALLLTGCRFFPDQLLAIEQPEQSDAGVMMPRRAVMSAAVSGAGRSAGAASSPAVVPRTAAAAGSGGAGGGGSAQMSADKPKEMMLVSAGASGEHAAGSGGSSAEAPKGAQDPTCDFTGVWMTKQIAVTLALEEPQFANSWGFFEIEQSGTDFVVKNHIDCGGEGLGSGTASVSRATLEALVQHNKQIGRKGTFALMDGKCALEVSRFWSVRGVDEMRYLPNPTRDSTLSVAEVAQMNPLPTPAMPDGAVDFEGDGELGAATQISGIISGVRNSCQRDWDRWFSAPGYEVTPSMDFTSDFIVRIQFEGEETVMAPTTGLLTGTAESTDEWEHIMRFHFLGRTLDDPRAQAIVHADQVETCYAIQDAMPAEVLQR